MPLSVKNTIRDFTPPIFWRTLLALKNRAYTLTNRDEHLSDDIYNFFTTFQDFRTNERCSIELGIALPVVERVRDQLYREHRLGIYSLGLQGPPQHLMREFIHSQFELRKDSLILEIGPGAYPLFPKQEYSNCFSVDKYGAKGTKLTYLRNLESLADFQGSYSTFDSVPEITEIVKQTGGFDIVAGSHSFEHETCPLKGLRNICSVLRKSGRVILFVPDGWSDDMVSRDPTHTMYLTPEMIREFFDEVGGFKELMIKPFRPNLDIMISAVKVSDSEE
jgi:hypothetical protein